MMGDSPKVLECADFDSHSPDTDLRDRHLHDWVWGGLQWGENRGPMVGRGRKNAYLLPGITSSNPGSEMLRHRANQPDNYVEDRQYHSNLLHQQTELGGTVSPLLTKDLWLWCMNRNITLQAVHLAEKMSVIAKEESRLMKDRTGWMLCPNIFRSLNQRLGPLKVDLSASRLTNQLAQYVSWRPDPEAIACDAFSLNWSTMKGYANPPWNLIGKVLAQTRSQKARLVLITPLWKLVPNPPQHGGRHSTSPTSGEGHHSTDPQMQRSRCPPTASRVGYLRDRFRSQGLSGEASKLLLCLMAQMLKKI